MNAGKTIIIGALAIFSGVVCAHPNWGVTTKGNYHWARKTAPAVGVQIQIVPWAQILPEGPLELTNGSVGTYDGCVTLNLRNNFRGLSVHAEVTPREQRGNWSVSLTETGETPIYEPDATSLFVAQVHLGAPHPLALCVMVQGLDLNAFEYAAGEAVTVAEVTITMYMENGAPVGNKPAVDVLLNAPGGNE